MTALMEGLDGVVSDLAAGMAGEHLVMADLLLQGHRAIMAEQHCPYDIVVDMPSGLIRVQVKSARAPRSEGAGNQRQPAYIWSIRRAGKNGKRTYGEDEFDLLALVALDLRAVAYVPVRGTRQHFQIRAPGWTRPELDSGGRPWRAKPGRDFTGLTFPRALAALNEPALSMVATTGESA